MSSNFTSSTNISYPSASDFDKVHIEKANIENQLVMYKLKYAEQSSKVIELEDDRENLQKKNETLSEKVKVKDDIIKSLINERDSIKYRQSSGCNTIKLNGYMTERANESMIKTQQQWSACNSPERKDHKLDRSEISDNKMTVSAKKAKNNLIINTEQNERVNVNMGIHPGTSKNSSGFVKILKNIFISDKK
jgi:hypothetical protein